MSIDFRERHTAGYSFQLEVRRSGALIGHVRGGSGVYRYYRGELNELTAEFKDRNLDRLNAASALSPLDLIRQSPEAKRCIVSRSAAIAASAFAIRT